MSAGRDTVDTGWTNDLFHTTSEATPFLIHTRSLGAVGRATNAGVTTGVE